MRQAFLSLQSIYCKNTHDLIKNSLSVIFNTAFIRI